MRIKSRMKPRLLIPLLALWGLTACEQPTDNTATLGSLTGLVLDRNSGGPLNALVLATVNGVSDTTEYMDFPWLDSLGAYFLDSLSTGLETIIVSRELYYTQEYLVDIAPGANEIDFYLEPLCPYDTLFINERLCVRILGQWYVIDERGKGWEVENTEFTVKYKADVSDEEIAAFNEAMGIQVARFNKLGYYDLKVPEGTDPLCTILAYLASGLVDYISPNTFGEI